MFGIIDFTINNSKFILKSKLFRAKCKLKIKF